MGLVYASKARIMENEESSSRGEGEEMNKDDLRGNKDDLTKTRTVLEESLDSEMSLRHDAPCHPRVMDQKDADSTDGGYQVPDRSQEEGYKLPSLPPSTRDLGRGTKGQSSVNRSNLLIKGCQFADEDELDKETVCHGVRDTKDVRRMTLCGGVQDVIATRPEDGGRNEEPRCLRMSPLPEPSSGTMVNADRRQIQEDALHDSRSLHMKHGTRGSLPETPSTRGGEEDERGGQEALVNNTTSEPSVGPEHSAAKRQHMEDDLLDLDNHGVRDERRSCKDAPLDSHAPRTDHDELGQGQGVSQECATPEPSTSGCVELPHHAAGCVSAVTIANDCVTGETFWAGGKGDDDDALMSNQASLAPMDDPRELSSPGTLEYHGGGAPGERMKDDEQRTDSPRVDADDGPSTPGPRVCSYSKGRGVCDAHGPGAKYHWKPIPKEDQVPGPDGKLKTRLYYWVCMLGPKGKRNLRQQMIQFERVRNQDTVGDRPDDEDDNSRSVDKEDSTTTGGD